MSAQTRAKVQAFKDRAAAVRQDRQQRRVDAQQAKNALQVAPNPAAIGKTWDYGAPVGGNTGSIASGYNTGAPNPADTGMTKATPMGGSQTSNLNTLAKLNPGFNTGTPATNITSGTPNTTAGTPADFYNTPTTPPPPGAVYKRGGAVKAKKMASGGMTSNLSPASKRADGIAQRGKTKCKMY